MLRVLALLFIFAIAEGCRVPCHWKDPKPLVDYYDALANKVIALDRMINDHCRANNVPDDVKYQHDENSFKMIIPIAGFEPEDIVVKAGRRLLFIEAANCDEGLKYSDIRFIPDYLSLSRGRWMYEEDELTISIPYSSGSRFRKHYLDFNNRNLQSGTIALRRGDCSQGARASRRRPRRDEQSSTHNQTNT